MEALINKTHLISAIHLWLCTALKLQFLDCMLEQACTFTISFPLTDCSAEMCLHTAVRPRKCLMFVHTGIFPIKSELVCSKSLLASDPGSCPVFPSYCFTSYCTSLTNSSSITTVSFKCYTWPLIEQRACKTPIVPVKAFALCI